MTTQHSALYDAASRGWETPAVYSDIAAEYAAITTAAAVHDASYVGRLKAVGEDTLDLLNRLSTNKVIDLEPGQGAPTILTTDRGPNPGPDRRGQPGRGRAADYQPRRTGAGHRVPDKYTIMEDLEVEDVTLHFGHAVGHRPRQRRGPGGIRQRLVGRTGPIPQRPDVHRRGRRPYRLPPDGGTCQL